MFSFALLYVISTGQSNEEGLKFEHWHLVYTADRNLLGESVHTVKEKENLFWYQYWFQYSASKEVGLAVNVDKTNYMACLVSRLQDKVTNEGR